MFYPIISQNMRKHTLLIVALLLFTFCEKAFSQNVIVKINIGGEVVSPVTLSTSKGKIIVDGSATFNENISIYSGTDALGRQIVAPLGNSKIATGKPTVREYNIKTVYKPNNEDDEIVDYSSGYENDGNRNITGSVTKTITSGADKFIDTAIDGINYKTDGYPNAQLALGISRVYGEFARLKLCLGGAGGFTLYGGIGKDLLFNSENSDVTAWHAGIGWYLSSDENKDFTIGLCYSETPVVDRGALMADLSYSYFFGSKMLFGIFGGGGIGLGKIKDMTVDEEGNTKGGKFLWDLNIGIAIRLWQK